MEDRLPDRSEAGRGDDEEATWIRLGGRRQADSTPASMMNRLLPVWSMLAALAGQQNRSQPESNPTLHPASGETRFMSMLTMASAS